MKVPLSENRLVALALLGVVLTAGVTAVLATPGLLDNDVATTDAGALDDGPPANDSFTPAEQTQSSYEEDEHEEDEEDEYEEGEHEEDEEDEYEEGEHEEDEEDEYEEGEHEESEEDEYEDDDREEDDEEYADQSSLVDDDQLVVGGAGGVPSA